MLKKDGKGKSFSLDNYLTTEMEAHTDRDMPGMVAYMRKRERVTDKRMEGVFYGDQYLGDQEYPTAYTKFDKLRADVAKNYDAKPVEPLIVKDNTRNNMSYAIHSNGGVEAFVERGNRRVTIDTSFRMDDEFLAMARRAAGMKYGEHCRPTGEKADWTAEDVARISDFRDSSIDAWKNAKLINDDPKIRSAVMEDLDMAWKGLDEHLDKSRQVHNANKRAEMAASIVDVESEADFDTSYST